MKGNKELAVKKFKQGYNCCQAVACAYCEELGIKEEDVFRLTEGFGLGMGGLRDTCGAVTGMFLVISLANSAGDMEHPLKTKMDTYAGRPPGSLRKRTAPSIAGILRIWTGPSR